MFKIQSLGACFVLLWGQATVSALSIPEIVNKTKPAVPKIYDSSGKPARIGTGFSVADDGRVVTNKRERGQPMSQAFAYSCPMSTVLA